MDANTKKKAAMTALLALAAVDREVRVATEAHLASRDVQDEHLATLAAQLDLTDMWALVVAKNHDIAAAKDTRRFKKSLRSHIRRAAAFRADNQVAAEASDAEDAPQSGDAATAPDAAPEPYPQDDDQARVEVNENFAASESFREHEDEGKLDSSDSSSSSSSSSALSAPFSAPASGLSARELAQRQHDAERSLVLLAKAQQLGIPTLRGFTDEIEDKLRTIAIAILRRTAAATGGPLTPGVIAVTKTFHGAEFIELALDQGKLVNSDDIPDEIKSALIDPASTAEHDFAVTLQLHAAMAPQGDASTRSVDDYVIKYDVVGDQDLLKVFPSAKLREWQTQLDERRQPILICLVAVRSIAANVAIRGRHANAAETAGVAYGGTSEIYMQVFRTQLAHLQARYADKIVRIQTEIRDASGLREGVEEALGLARSGTGKNRTRDRIIPEHERRLLVQVARDQAIVNAVRKDRGKPQNQRSQPKKSGKKSRQRRPERAVNAVAANAPPAQAPASAPPTKEPLAPAPYPARSRSPAPQRREHDKKDHFRGRGPARH